MADHTEIIERAKKSSPLADREIAEADQRSSPSAKIVHEAIRLEGTEELERSSWSVGWSGLAAGLTICCSMLAQGILQSELSASPWRELVASLGYSFGFLFVTMGRQQLFTETTLTVILPLLHKSHRVRDVARYWVIVFSTNVIGTLLFAAAMMIPHLLPNEAANAFADLGVKTAEPGALVILAKGVFAGWLIALMVWLLPAAGSARFGVIVAITWLIGIAHFSHVVAGSVETAFAAMSGLLTWEDYLVFMITALIGNSIGGVVFVALLNHAQVRKEI